MKFPFIDYCDFINITPGRARVRTHSLQLATLATAVRRLVRVAEAPATIGRSVPLAHPSNDYF